MSSLPTSLLEKIRKAQTVNGIAQSEPMVPHNNIGELLSERTDSYEIQPFLIFYSDEGYRKELSYREFYEEVCKTANFLEA